jgi:hypothetical protein
VERTEAARQEADRLVATAVQVADGGRSAGAVLLRDRIRTGIREAAGRFAEMGISRTIMPTGGRRAAARTSESLPFVRRCLRHLERNDRRQRAFPSDENRPASRWAEPP